MDIFDRLGIDRYLNAHDTYTVYGGSRMEETTLRAMEEISRHFVDIEQLQRNLGARLAHMTHNEAAYITNGASGACLLAACVCMAKGSLFHFSRLPETRGLANEIVVMRCQRNAYDQAIRASGAAIVEIGDADETLPFELEGVLSEKTAAVFYFASSLYAHAAMPLAEAIRIAHEKGAPVVVDAAAQLPPVENLWAFTAMGADLVIFSGGKTLKGPQDSGLMVGRKDLIEDCIRFGAPVHGICRSSKVSREGMIGLYMAVENYVAMDHAGHQEQLLAMARRFVEAMEHTGKVRGEVVHRGPVGQTYPRAFGYLGQDMKAEKLAEAMRKRCIYIGLEPEKNAVYLSPLNLKEEEAQTVAEALLDCIAQYGSDVP